LRRAPLGRKRSKGDGKQREGRTFNTNHERRLLPVFEGATRKDQAMGLPAGWAEAEARSLSTAGYQADILTPTSGRQRHRHGGR
jgi:hypothetical protein